MKTLSMPDRSLRLALLCMLHHAAMTGCRAVLPLIALERGAGQAVAGALVAVQALVPALLALPLGRLIERRGTRCSASLGMGASAVALLLLSQMPQVSALFATAAVVGAGYGLTLVSVQRELGRCIDEGDARAYDRFSLMTALSSCIGPWSAGAVLAAVGAPWAAVGLGVLCAAALAGTHSSWSVPAASPASHAQTQSPSVLPASTRPVLAAEVVISLLWNAIAMLAILRAHAAGWSATDATGLLAVLGGGVAIARVASRWITGWLDDRQLIRLSMTAAALGVLTFLAALPWWACCAVQAVVGFGLGLSLSPVLGELHRRCATGDHTRVLAVRQVLLNGCAVVGPAAAGAVAGGAGTALLCLAMGVGALVAVCSLKI
jgi:predicted MFS family arabinose efflux permease